MTFVSEYDIVQNSALGGLALWAFSAKFFEATNKQNGPILPITMIVLPIVFHKKTVSLIYNRNFDGGLFKVIAEDRTIFAGLQHRMEDMFDQTIRSLNIAFSSKLLDYDKITTQLIPKRKTPPYQIDVGETRQILAASNRLGYWCATLSTEQICVLLKVRF